MPETIYDIAGQRSRQGQGTFEMTDTGIDPRILLALQALEVDSDWPAHRLFKAIDRAIAILCTDPRAFREERK